MGRLEDIISLFIAGILTLLDCCNIDLSRFLTLNLDRLTGKKRVLVPKITKSSKFSISVVLFGYLATVSIRKFLLRESSLYVTYRLYQFINYPCYVRRPENAIW